LTGWQETYEQSIVDGVPAVPVPPPQFERDTVPPAVPTGLSLSSDLATAVDGSAVVRLTATVTQPPDEDLWATVVEVTADNVNDDPVWTSPAVILIGREATAGSLLGVRGSTRYWARAYAEDVSGNASAYTAIVSIVTVGDAEAPPIPVNVVASGGFRGAGVRWDSVGVSDLDVYELQYAPDAGGSADLGRARVLRMRTTAVWVDGLSPSETYWFRVRAVDRSGNVRTSAVDPTAVKAVDEPGAGWSDWVTAVPTSVGSADIAANSIISQHISAAGLSADVIKSGYLRVSTTDANVADGIEIISNGKRVGFWDETGLYVGTQDRGLPAGLGAVDYVRITEAGLTVFRDGVAQTAITPDGINASAISFGTLQGGHNVVRNSSFELTSFGTLPSSATWDVQADWNASRVGTDTNVTTGAGSLTMTGVSY
jgi:hypothetical protein